MNNSLSETSQKKRCVTLQSTVTLSKKYAPIAVARCASQLGVTQNNLLASLDADDLATLVPHLELVQLSYDTELHQHGDTLSHIYFPTTAMVASLLLLSDGNVVEIGMTGQEGLIGASILMSDRALGTAKVQRAGFAFKLPASVIKESCTRCARLKALLLRYTQATIARLVLCAACENHCSVEQKLTRWLLDRLDRSPNNHIQVTQEMIATMLGVRRESVTEAVGRLRKAGLIRSIRGTIEVLDRNGLESNAGESYRVARQEFDLVLADANMTRSKYVFAA